jgi:hypothetical protein
MVLIAAAWTAKPDVFSMGGTISGGTWTGVASLSFLTVRDQLLGIRQYRVKTRRKMPGRQNAGDSRTRQPTLYSTSSGSNFVPVSSFRGMPISCIKCLAR